MTRYQGLSYVWGIQRGRDSRSPYACSANTLVGKQTGHRYVNE